MISITDTLGTDIDNAIEAKDEVLLKKLILKAMALFLEDEIDKSDLYGLAALYMTTPIRLGWSNNFQFKDEKLGYVYEALTEIEELTDKRAKENVKRFLLYLEGKDYENIKK